MIENDSIRRSYKSPLRLQQLKITREKIMYAVTELISEGCILTFSIKDVAERADISYGTVYHHFPTRESLLEGLYEFATEILEQDFSFKSLAIDGLPEVTKKTGEVFERNFGILQAFTTVLATKNIQPRSRRKRDQKYLDMVKKNAASLPAGAAKQAAAIIAHLHSSLTWVTLRQRFDLGAKDTADALEWVLKLIIQDLLQRSEVSKNR